MGVFSLAFSLFRLIEFFHGLFLEQSKFPTTFNYKLVITFGFFGCIKSFVIDAADNS